MCLFQRSLFAVLLAFVAWPAQATIVAPADVPILVAEARAIAHGRVVDVRAEWLAERRDIQTLVTLRVERYLKGHAGQMLTFRVPGGEVGIYRSVIVAAPTFEAGDEVILFLGGGGAAVPHVLGLSQGVFRVHRAGDGDPVVAPAVPLSGSERGSAGSPLRLDEFSREVAALLAGSRGAR